MKKLLLFILAIFPFLGVVETSFALSYDSAISWSVPSFVKNGTAYPATLLGTTPCAYYTSWAGCSYWTNSIWSVTTYPYYFHTDGTAGFGENYKGQYNTIVEIDLTNNPTASGARLVDGGTTVDGYFFDWTMSGIVLTYRMYTPTAIPVVIYTHSWEFPQLADYQSVNFGGYHPKNIVLNLSQSYYSYNNLLGAGTYLQRLSVQRITNTSRTAYVDFTDSGATDGLKINNTFTASFARGPFLNTGFNGFNFWGNVSSIHSTSPDFFPYWEDNPPNEGSTPQSYYGNMRLFKNSYYFAYGNLTTRIRDTGTYQWGNINDNGWSVLQELDNNLALFYTATGNTVFGYGASSAGGTTGGGGTSGSGTSGGGTSGSTDYFSSCTSYLDVGCYVQGLSSQLSSTIGNFTSGLFPSWISTSSGGLFDFSTNSGATLFTGSFVSFDSAYFYLDHSGSCEIGSVSVYQYDLLEHEPGTPIDSEYLNFTLENYTNNLIGKKFLQGIDYIMNKSIGFVGRVTGTFFGTALPPMNHGNVCFMGRVWEIEYQKFIPTHDSLTPTKFNRVNTHTPGDPTTFDWLFRALATIIAMVFLYASGKNISSNHT